LQIAYGLLPMQVEKAAIDWIVDAGNEPSFIGT
jgi:hypothetical protein